VVQATDIAVAGPDGGQAGAGDSANGGAGGRPSVVGAGGWALGARAVAQIAQLALFIVAARVLNPADFGLFALVQAASVLLFVVAAAGWREFIMGWGGNPRAVNQAITLSIFSGYAMAFIGLGVAYTAVLRFEAPVVGALSAILSLTVLISPITNAFGAILVRRGDLRAMSVSTILAEIFGLAVGVWALMEGWGILALGVSKLAMQFLNLIGVMLAARWPVKLLLRGGYGSKIIEVSRQILAHRVISFVSSNAGVFIVGSFLGIFAVGLYRAAERVVSSIAELIFEPLRLVGWMMFRNAADKAKSADGTREELTREASFFLPLLIIFASPIFVGLAVVAEDIIVVLLGEAWRGAAPVASLLAVSALLMVPTVATEPLLTMTGKINRLPPVALFNAIVAVVVLFAFVQFGLLAAAAARLVASAVTMLTAVWLQDRYAKAPWWRTIKMAAPVYTALVALVAAVVGARMLMANYEVLLAVKLAIEVGVGAVAYFVVLYVIRPSYLRSALGL